MAWNLEPIFQLSIADDATIEMFIDVGSKDFFAHLRYMNNGRLGYLDLWSDKNPFKLAQKIEQFADELERAFVETEKEADWQQVQNTNDLFLLVYAPPKLIYRIVFCHGQYLVVQEFNGKIFPYCHAFDTPGEANEIVAFALQDMNRPHIEERHFLLSNLKL